LEIIMDNTPKVHDIRGDIVETPQCDDPGYGEAQRIWAQLLNQHSTARQVCADDGADTPLIMSASGVIPACPEQAVSAGLYSPAGEGKYELDVYEYRSFAEFCWRTKQVSDMVKLPNLFPHPPKPELLSKRPAGS
jgi:hypothetical protein